jgi:hypothetical protein
VTRRGAAAGAVLLVGCARAPTVRAPLIIDADRARSDAAASEGTRKPTPPVVGPCRWRAEYSSTTDCQ